MPQGRWVYNTTGERHPHPWLMATARKTLRAAEEPKGSFYNALSAMVFAWFALEAAVNVMGCELFGDEHWLKHHERKPALKKIDKIASKLQISAEVNEASEPLKTVVALHKFRNYWVHGKKEVINENSVGSGDDEPAWSENEMEKRCNHEEAKRMVTAVDDLAKKLWAATYKGKPQADGGPWVHPPQVTHGSPVE